MRELTIQNRIINDESAPFVIAEIGHNHGGDLQVCKKMFAVAKECGVDAVKIQKRDNKTLYTKTFYDSVYNSENAFASTYGSHREALEFGAREYRELKNYADKLGLIFFATPFDFKSVDFLVKLGVPCFKTASGDLTNIPLLEYIATKKKPMIISTGAATMRDVRRAFRAVHEINRNFTLLQCTAVYPVQADQMNLRVIEAYRRSFPHTVIGLSDHYNGIVSGSIAYTLGARVFEKHFTLDRTMKGTDHAFSLEPRGMTKFVRDLHKTRRSLGDGVKRQYPEEESARVKMGKKIVAARNLPRGHKIASGDLAFKSPGDGLHPYCFEKLCGRTLKSDLQKDDALNLGHI